MQQEGRGEQRRARKGGGNRRGGKIRGDEMRGGEETTRKKKRGGKEVTITHKVRKEGRKDGARITCEKPNMATNFLPDVNELLPPDGQSGSFKW